jgi:hypothetical protein
MTVSRQPPIRAEEAAPWLEALAPADRLQRAAYWHDLEHLCRDRTRDAMAAARADGASLRELGRALGVGPASVDRTLRRHAARAVEQ